MSCGLDEAQINLLLQIVRLAYADGCRARRPTDTVGIFCETNVASGVSTGRALNALRKFGLVERRCFRRANETCGSDWNYQSELQQTNLVRITQFGVEEVCRLIRQREGNAKLVRWIESTRANETRRANASQ